MMNLQGVRGEHQPAVPTPGDDFVIKSFNLPLDILVHFSEHAEDYVVQASSISSEVYPCFLVPL